MIASLTFAHVLQVLRYELRWSLATMARHLNLCPGCYRAMESGRALPGRHVHARLVAAFPYLPVLLQAGDDGESLPVAIHAVKASIDRLAWLPSDEQDVTLSRIALELAWLDAKEPVPQCAEGT